MLLSLLLTITPKNPTIISGFFGREVQAWLLQEIARYDADFANALHEPNLTRPYTVSDLILHDAGRRGPEGQVTIMPGDEAQIRITSMETHLSEFLLTQVAQNLPNCVRLKWAEFRELRLSEENGWNGQSTFEALLEEGQAAQRESVTLEFATPTAFRAGQVDQTLPTPELVWTSLYRKWNTFAPEALRIDPLWEGFVQNCFVVSDFHLRSRKVSFNQGSRGAVTGATGKATYRLLPAKHCGNYAAFRDGSGAVLRTLAGFALFSGVGHHTSWGLGQTRWVS